MENTNTATEVKDSKYSKEELIAIFDNIMFEGSYSEVITIKGKLKVEFKSRSAKDTSEISKELDAKSFNLISTIQEQRALLSLAYSIITYNGRDLSSMKIEDRKEFVGSLPTAVVAALSEALVTFDMKVDEACREGEENF